MNTIHTPASHFSSESFHQLRSGDLRARKRNERQANITLKEKHHALQHVRSRGWQSDLPSLRSGATPGQSPS